MTRPPSMRAAVQIGYGGIDDSIELADVPTPVPSDDEVLVRVLATTVNRKDLFALANLSGPGIRPRPPLPHVNGGDLVCEVVDVGAGVKDWTPGDRAVGYSGLYCTRCEWCERGETTACTTYGVLGEQRWGTHAAFATVPARNLERVPHGTPIATLACACGSWTTAWRALITVAGVRPGETVLVLGASGGVGTGAIRIAKMAGCRVIAAVGSAWKAAQAIDAGADDAVEYTEAPLREAVRARTEGAGVDVVLDSVGAATWRDSINVLRPFGRMVVCGATSGDVPQISIRELYQQHRRILGAPLGSRREFRELTRALVRGALAPIVHATLPLDRIHEALRLLDSRASFGKVVLVP